MTKTIPGLEGPVRDEIYDHVFANPGREVGGVLVGQVAPTGGSPWVEAAIPAINADEQRATLTFTQEAWEHVHTILDHEFPEYQIVGWYHSHPGFGIFLSEHDLFIHRNFFSGLSQIAFVVDPHEGTEGVFGWRDGDVAPLYHKATARSPIGPLPRHQVSVGADQTEPGGGPAIARPRRSYPAAPLAMFLLVGVLVGFVLFLGVLDADEPTVPGVSQEAVEAGEPATEGRSEPNAVYDGDLPSENSAEEAGPPDQP